MCTVTLTESPAATIARRGSESAAQAANLKITNEGQAAAQLLHHTVISEVGGGNNKQSPPAKPNPPATSLAQIRARKDSSRRALQHLQRQLFLYGPAINGRKGGHFCALSILAPPAPRVAFARGLALRASGSLLRRLPAVKVPQASGALQPSPAVRVVPAKRVLSQRLQSSSPPAPVAPRDASTEASAIVDATSDCAHPVFVMATIEKAVMVSLSSPGD